MAWANLRANLQTPIAGNFPALQSVAPANTHNLHYIDNNNRKARQKKGKKESTQWQKLGNNAPRTQLLLLSYTRSANLANISRGFLSFFFLLEGEYPWSRGMMELAR